MAAGSVADDLDGLIRCLGGDFLSGGEAEQVVFVAERDDADRVTVRIASFAEP